MSTITRTNAVCISVVNLRKMGFTDLDHWLQDSNNVYTGRFGRIWIHESDGSKRIFHYAQSKWHNPNKVNKDTTAAQAVCQYLQHLIVSKLINDIEELRGKSLGCFCPSFPCHAILLSDILNRGLDVVLKQYNLSEWYTLNK